MATAILTKRVQRDSVGISLTVGYEAVILSVVILHQLCAAGTKESPGADAPADTATLALRGVSFIKFQQLLQFL